MNKELPFISAKCITYGRVDTLEEAIESFLRQDYPSDKCELVIVNDYPLQELVYDHPQIKIFNLKETFSPLGAKENFATKQCKGDIICQWDDDDIALPNHLQNVAKHMKGINLLHWVSGVYWNEPNITAITWLGNSGIVYRKEAWLKVGGYPMENAGYDKTFVSSLERLGDVLLCVLKEEDVSWFYRWGFLPMGKISKVGVYHNSGQGTDDEIRPNILERHALHIEERRKAGFIPTGVINLEPKWHYPYSEQLAIFVANSKDKKDGTP